MLCARFTWWSAGIETQIHILAERHVQPVLAHLAMISTSHCKVCKVNPDVMSSGLQRRHMQVREAKFPVMLLGLLRVTCKVKGSAGGYGLPTIMFTLLTSGMYLR